ncbi:hypothetical protein C9426_33185 [Serratia sp. S1B]|nr:hypothetical protein C9426_33185 [Serratia sp. S1B]
MESIMRTLFDISSVFNALRHCRTLLLSLLVLFSGNALATYTCYNEGIDVGWAISSTPLKAPSEAAIGESLGVVATSNPAHHITCANDLGEPIYLVMRAYFAPHTNNTVQAPYFLTNIPGIGFKLFVGSTEIPPIAGTVPKDYYNKPAPYYTDIAHCIGDQISGRSCSINHSASWRVEAFKIGNVTAGQTLSSSYLPIAYLRHYDSYSIAIARTSNNEASSLPEKWRYVYKITGVSGGGNMPPFAVPGTCNVTSGTEAINVFLPAVNASNFQMAYNYLSAGNTPFDIKVSCSGDTGGVLKLNVRDVNGSTNASGVLNSAAGNQAQNVRIQVMFGGGCDAVMPLTSNYYIAVKQFSGAPTNTTIPMCARYVVPDGSRPNGGMVRAQATYTISYP